MLCKIIVFPALGGEIIIDLCPLPIGLTRSINLGVKSCFFSTFVVSTSITNCLSGYNGVKLSNAILCLAFSGSSKLILLTCNNAKYLSPSLGALTGPSTVSPVLKPNFLI